MKEAAILACSVLHKEEIQKFKLQLTLKFNSMHFPSTYNLDSVWPSPVSLTLTDSYCSCRWPPLVTAADWRGHSRADVLPPKTGHVSDLLVHPVYITASALPFPHLHWSSIQWGKRQEKHKHSPCLCGSLRLARTVINEAHLAHAASHMPTVVWLMHAMPVLQFYCLEL